MSGIHAFAEIFSPFSLPKHLFVLAAAGEWTQRYIEKKITIADIMKLRIKGNSLRLRLTRPEVARMADEGRIEDRTEFADRSLRYVLESRAAEKAIGARFEEDAIVVSVPSPQVADWANGDEVGLYGEQPASHGGILTIAVEKDFRCLDRSRAEGDEADAYPHPLVKSRRAH